MVLVVDPSKEAETLAMLKAANEPARTIGRLVTKAEINGEEVVMKNLESWN